MNISYVTMSKEYKRIQAGDCPCSIASGSVHCRLARRESQIDWSVQIEYHCVWFPQVSNSVCKSVPKMTQPTNKATYNQASSALKPVEACLNLNQTSNAKSCKIHPPVTACGTPKVTFIYPHNAVDAPQTWWWLPSPQTQRWLRASLWGGGVSVYKS